VLQRKFARDDSSLNRSPLLSAPCFLERGEERRAQRGDHREDSIERGAGSGEQIVGSREWGSKKEEHREAGIEGGAQIDGSTERGE
jgi:hypothetical protein